LLTKLGWCTLVASLICLWGYGQYVRGWLHPVRAER